MRRSKVEVDSFHEIARNVCSTFGKNGLARLALTSRIFRLIRLSHRSDTRLVQIPNRRREIGFCNIRVNGVMEKIDAGLIEGGRPDHTID